MNSAGRLTRALVALSASCTVVCLASPVATVSAAGPAEPSAVPLSDCAASDNGDPVLTGLTITPRRIELTRSARTVRFATRFTDTGGPGRPSGVATVSLSLDNGRDTLEMRLSESADGTWRVTRRFRPGELEAGTYRVSVDYADAAGNIGSMRAEQLGAAGADDQLLVAAASRDAGAPVLRSLSVSRRTVDTTTSPRRVRFSARVSDDLSVRGVRVEAVGRRKTERADLRLSSGTERNGRWTGSVLVPRGIGSGRWHLGVQISDWSQNFRTYRTRALAARGSPTGFHVTSGRDREPPVVNAVTVTPAVVDVTTRNQSVSVQVRARDAGSGVAGGIFVFARSSSTISGHLRLIGGTVHDGTWRGTAVVDRCSAVTGKWTSGSVNVASIGRAPTGSATTRVELDPPTVVTTRDRDVPTATVVGRTQPPGGPLRFAFDEAVTGVSAASAVLAPTGLGDTALRRQSQSPIAGTWQCHDTAGVTVDCLGTAIREAWFTPDTPLLSGADYQLLLNPEHVLDMRDLAGNPFRRQQVAVVTAG